MLGGVLAELGKLEEAEELLRRATAVQREVLGQPHLGACLAETRRDLEPITNPGAASYPRDSDCTTSSAAFGALSRAGAAVETTKHSVDGLLKRPALPCSMEPCPIANMDNFNRAFLAVCHAHNPGAPCVYCGRDYEWHVREGVFGLKLDVTSRS